jgi:hypothetical protein
MTLSRRISSLLLPLLLIGTGALRSQSEPVPPQETPEEEAPPSDRAVKKSKKGNKKARKAALAALTDEYRLWLDSVDLIMSKEELDSFLELSKDYQRDAFIERFWQARDPYPQTIRPTS